MVNNIDEKGLQLIINLHTLLALITQPRQSHLEKASVTIIGAGSASGVPVPPFFCLFG